MQIDLKRFVGDTAMTMISRRAFNCGLLSIAAAASTSSARASSYPARPISIITQTPPGAGPDVIARIVGDGFAQRWHQQVLIVNRPGGGGAIALQSALGVPADGYSLFLALSSTCVVLPLTHPELGMRLRSELKPIGLIGEQPMAIALNSELPIRTLAELVVYAKTHPGTLLYGTNKGSLPHLTAEVFQQRAGIALTYVPYGSLAKATQDGAAGTTQVVFESLSGLAAPVKAGMLRLLAVASAKRVADYPDLPTVTEALPQVGPFESRGWFALMAPTDTPEPVVGRIGADLRSVLAGPNVKQRFAALGTYPLPTDAAEAAAFIAKEQTLWKPAVDRVLGLTH